MKTTESTFKMGMAIVCAVLGILAALCFYLSGVNVWLILAVLLLQWGNNIHVTYFQKHPETTKVIEIAVDTSQATLAMNELEVAVDRVNTKLKASKV